MRARSGLILLGLVATLAGCKPSTSGNGNGAATPAPEQPRQSQSKDNPNPDVGPDLYKTAPVPKFTTAFATAAETLVVQNFLVQFEDRQTVSAEVDGKVDLIGSPMAQRADGVYEFRQRDGTAVAYDPARPHPGIVFHPRDRVLFPNNREKWVPYWRLTEGDIVSAGQILCLMDDQVMTAKKNASEAIKKAAEEGREAAKKGVDYSERKIKLYAGKSGVGGVVSPAEELQDLLTLSRFVENLAQSSQTIAKAQGDLEEALVVLRKHQVTTRVDGVIRNVAKRPGEFVRAGEKIFEIQSTEKVRLEGNVDSQYERLIKRNMVVTIEPAVPSTPMKSYVGHRSEVTGVAVTGHAGRPLVLTAGMDGLVLVWDPNIANAKDRPAVAHNLPHPVAVRSVACTPPGAPALAATGADDGHVRIWDLSDPAKLPSTPKHDPADYHTAGVAAIAVSPDGAYAASAAGREVFVWNLAGGKKLYALPPEHRDSVTSLAFTPQGLLVTAAKDRTLKVWKLGKDKAAVTRTIEHRSGVVDTLSVSPDGGRVLFDQDKSRIDLVNLSDGQTAGQLANVGPSVAFSGFAVFGPKHQDPAIPADKQTYTVATAGGDGDLKGGLQVWHVPRAGGRGAESARLITPGRVAVTCAAFAPQKDSPFLVVGTAAGTVHVWTPPTGPAKRLEGRVTFTESTDPRYVTVRVEMNNKDLDLPDRSAATVIFTPGLR